MHIFIINEYFYQDRLGGSEYQCYLIAKFLVTFGHKVHYISLSNPCLNPELEVIDGFTLVRLNHISDFERLLHETPPDICYIRIFDRLMYLHRRISKFPGVKKVFHASSFMDVMFFPEAFRISLSPKKILGTIKRNLFHFYNLLALFKMDLIFSLSETVAHRLSRFSFFSEIIRDSVELKNPMELLCSDRIDKFSKKTVIWVANLKALKRPELYIKLAEHFKDEDVDFLMVGSLQDKKYSKEIAVAEKRLKNFHYLGFRPINETTKLINKSLILIHTTSSVEGFSNNFIIAWLCSVPTITLSFDPDGIIENKKLGFHSKTLGQLFLDVKLVLNNSKLREDMGARAHEFASKEFNADVNIKKLEGFLLRLLS